MNSILNTLNATVNTHHLWDHSSVLLLMVSGGGDSVALLDLLTDEECAPFSHLEVFHLNHSLRGDESDLDAKFVSDLCERYHITCHIRTLDIATIAAVDKLNVEEAGRINRYDAAEEILAEMCQSYGAAPTKGRIVSAHTLDDRVETFFTRALYGAGAGALASIPAKRDNIVRPVISCTRTEMRDYLTSHNLDWREDASNFDLDRQRAAIRHTLIPACETINPSFRNNLERTMNILADDDAILAALSTAFGRDFVDDALQSSHVTFNVNLMRTLQSGMARRTIRDAIIDTFPDASRLDSTHINALTNGLADPDFARDLPFDLRATRTVDTLRVAKRTVVAHCPECEISEPGKTAVGAMGIFLIEETADLSIAHNSLTITIDADKLLGTLSAGPARTAERMHPLGLEGSKKVSDIFTDEKIARDLRQSIPILRDGKQIVWIAGIKLSDSYKIDEDTKNVYRITWTPNLGEGPK